jgi:hypothetical protein
MDVEIIFKRLAYTAATGGVVAVYVAIVALIGTLFHTAPTVRQRIAAIVLASYSLPCRMDTGAAVDYYRDRFNIAGR